jgi:MFS family permease
MNPQREKGAEIGIEETKIVETHVPARLDRLPWGRFHTLVVVALGITWILDGLEVTLAGSIAGALEASRTLQFSAADIGLASSLYLLGAVGGALLFGWLTDRLGRRKLFFMTLGLYLVATAATGFAWDLPSFCFFRFFTGAGIGGEYAAINSTIQELIPARYRGATDLAINGSFWIGGALGAASSLVLLDPNIIDPEIGWRLSFLIGAILGLVILFLRRWIPESPRWLVLHGYIAEAESVTGTIEADFKKHGARLEDISAKPPLRLAVRRRTEISDVLHNLFVVYRTRALVGLTLMAAQAFFYNAIFFTYALVLTKFYDVPPGTVGWFILPFALGNVLGPLCLGRLFDSIGRKPMLAFTYGVSGLLLAATGFLFVTGVLDAAQQTLAWTIIFFFASAAASAAYLTVSETFPIEIRALAIAIFYAAGTGIGGVAAPYLFGLLIGTGSREAVLVGYLIGAGLMLFAAVVAAIFGVAAERKPLESVARPLSSVSESDPM